VLLWGSPVGLHVLAGAGASGIAARDDGRAEDHQATVVKRKMTTMAAMFSHEGIVAADCGNGVAGMRKR
jgi:hypothetical protein